MSIDAAVAWAKKMADVLGEKLSISDEQVAVKTPRGGGAPKAGGGGTPPTNGGTPSANGAPSSNGAPAATGTPTSGDTPQSTGSPNASGEPAAADSPAPARSSASAGGTAKECADAAQKALAQADSLLAKTREAEAEALKAVTDSEAGKKKVDEAKTQAEEAEKGIGDPPALPAPTGDDARAQYDSAIQITGQMQTALAEAEDKESTVRAQVGVAAEGLAEIEVAEKTAKKSAEQADKLAMQVGDAAYEAEEAARAAEKAAGASKAKADQAKDDDPNKASLQKAAQEDAKFAAAAKDAATKAAAAGKKASEAVQNAETQSQKVEATKQEAKSITDGLKKLESNIFTKVGPFMARVGDAKTQEADCRAKLSAEEAQTVLEQRYIELGGDPELSQALADEDRDFTTITELHRAELKKWQKEKIRELDKHKAVLEGTIKEGEEFVAPVKKWLEKEIPVSVELVTEINSLGEKLKTEPGKALLHEYHQNTDVIEEAQAYSAFIEKVVEKSKASLEALDNRYKDVDAQYEASEKLIRDSRTELDNMLQMDEMSLEQKVDFLQSRPKPVRDRIKKNLDAELERVMNLTILEAAADDTPVELPSEPRDATPIDWESVKAKIAKIRETSLEELKQDDPKLAEAKEEYEKAGGDKALLEKRIARWKEEMADSERRAKSWADDFRKSSERLNQQLQEATLRLRDSEANANGFREVLAQKRQTLKILQQKANGKDGTAQDKASVELLTKEISRIEINLKNYQNEVAANKAAKANAEKLIEAERRRHEEMIDDDVPEKPKPTADDISRLPFPVKYQELTGNSLPA